MESISTARSKASKAVKTVFATFMALCVSTMSMNLPSPAPAYADETVAENASVGLEEYTEENLDTTKVSGDLNYSGFTMIVKQTYIDSEAAGVKSVKEFFDEWGATHMLASYEDDEVPVYYSEDDDDVFVAAVDQSKQNNLGRTVASNLTYNDDYQEESLIDQCTYDDENGLLYIPKSFFVNDDNSVVDYTLTFQNLIALDTDKDGAAKDTDADITVAIDNHYSGVTAPARAKVTSADAFDVTTSFQIATAETAANVDTSKLHVYLNGSGSEYELNFEETDDKEATAVYDEETGELTIAVSPARLSRIDVTIDPSSVIDSVMGVQNAYADRLKDFTADDLKKFKYGKKVTFSTDQAKEGDLFVFPGTKIYYVGQGNGSFTGKDATWKNACRANTRGYVYTPMTKITSVMKKIANGNDKNYDWDDFKGDTYDDLWRMNDSSNGFANFLFQLPTGNGYQVTGSDNLEPKYNKNGDTVNFDGWLYTDVKKTDAKTQKKGEHKYLAGMCSDTSSAIGDNTTKEMDVLIRFLKRTSNYDILAFVTPGTAGSQLGMAIIKIGKTSGGQIKVTKDPDQAAVAKQLGGKATIEGAEYTIYKNGDTDKNTVSSPLKDDDGNNETITIDADGEGYSETIDAGTYYIKETAASPGYDKDPNVYKVTVTAGQTTEESIDKKATAKSVEPFTPGYLYLNKKSENSDCTDGNPNYSLANAEYYVYTDSACTDRAIDLSTGKAAVLTTDANGKTNTAKFAVGKSGSNTYYVKETQASLGYRKCEDTHEVTVKKNQTGTITCEEPPITDPSAMNIQKVDSETAEPKSQGTASLAGAEFTINFYAVDVAQDWNESNLPEKPTRSWVVKTDSDGLTSLQDAYANSSTYFVSGDDYYVNSDGDVVLPRGVVTVQETKASNGYNLPENTELQIQKVVNKGDLKSYTGTETMGDELKAIYEPIQRANIEFSKTDGETQELMPNTPFVITAHDSEGKVTEQHVVVTDRNGNYSSDRVKHSSNTNKNDEAVTITKDGKTYTLAEASAADIEVGDEGVSVSVDESKLSYKYGTWFGAGIIDDDKGAFYFDEPYVMSELPVAANASKTLVTREFIIDETYDGQKASFGPVQNWEPQLSTTAYDPDDNDNQVGVGQIKICDKVHYTHLNTNTEYTITGELHDAETGDAIIDESGKTISATGTFKPTATTGDYVMEFEFDSTNYAGKTIVVYETLTDSTGTEKASEKNKDNVSQQITVVQPEIKTSATDKDDGDKTVVPDEKTTIVDTVSYRGLIPGRTYVMTGTIHLKNADGSDAGELKGADGKAITVTKEFTPTHSDDTVELEFTVDTRSFDDNTEMVVFEDCSLDGKSIAVHADITDKGQTVTVPKPKVHTTAVDGEDGDKEVAIAKTVSIVDTVEYSGLKVGQTYTVTGTLHTKKTYKDFDVTVNGEKFGDGYAVESNDEGTIFKYYTDKANNCYVSLTKNDDGTWTLYKQEPKSLVDQVVDAITGGDESSSDEEGSDAEGDSESESEDESESESEGSDSEIPGGILDQIADAMSGLTDGDTEDESEPEDDTESEGDDEEGTDEDTDEGDTEEGDDEGEDADEDSDFEDTDDATGLKTSSQTIEAANVSVSDTGNTITVEDELKGADGKAITASKEFTAENTHGSVPVTFTFDGTLLEAGVPVVAFESLFQNGVEIATHADINDEGQTVEPKEPTISTKAFDGLDGDKKVTADEASTVVDEVSYKNVVVDDDITYTLAGLIVDPSTKLPMLFGDASEITEDELKEFTESLKSALGIEGDITGNSVKFSTDQEIDWDAVKAVFADNAEIAEHLGYGTKDFVAKHSSNTEKVEFKNLNTFQLGGKDLTVVELLVKDGKYVTASHVEFDSEDQTVEVEGPEIGTTLTDKTDGDHEILQSKTTTVVDTVKYENLVIGKEYTMTGTLMDKSTNEPLKVNDKKVTATAKFTPNKTSGTVEVEFTFDTTGLKAGDNIVAFEKCFKSGVETAVAVHEDINDKSQTVTVKKGGDTPDNGGGNGQDTATLKTAMDMLPGIIATLMILAAAGAAFYYLRRRKNGTEE